MNPIYGKCRGLVPLGFGTVAGLFLPGRAIGCVLVDPHEEKFGFIYGEPKNVPPKADCA